MSEATHYVLGPDIADDEEIRDSDGRIVDDAYVDGATAEAITKARGRPSLSASGESPLLRVRLPQELNNAVTAAAVHDGMTRSEWVRKTLADATGSAATD